MFGTLPTRLDALILDLPIVPGGVHRVAAPLGSPSQCLVFDLPGLGGRRDLLLPPADGGGPASPNAAWDTLELLPLPLLRLSPLGRGAGGQSRGQDDPPLPPMVQPRLSDLLEGLGRPVGEWVADVAGGRPNPGPQFLRGTGSHQDITLRVSLSLAGTDSDP